MGPLGWCSGGQSVVAGQIAGGGDHIDEPRAEVGVEIGQVDGGHRTRLGEVAGHHDERGGVTTRQGVSTMPEFVDGVGPAQPGLRAVIEHPVCAATKSRGPFGVSRSLSTG